MRLATRMIKRGLPCLQLFGERTTDVRLSDRHADIYDSYADMFTVLAVRLFTGQITCCMQANGLLLHHILYLRRIGRGFNRSFQGPEAYAYTCDPIPGLQALQYEATSL